MLHVRLAGGVRVELDGLLVDDRHLGGRQGRRLLAHLAWASTPLHRDVLADGIWPDRLPRTWERTLSGVVTRLRVGLAAAGVDGEIIRFSDGCYLLVGGGDVEVDVVRAAEDLRRAERSVEDGELEVGIRLAEAAVAVARLPLIPGEDAAWVDDARVRHREMLMRTLDVLADAQRLAGRFSLSESAGRELVHWEPLREAGHQRLLRALLAKGDRAATLIAYASCRRVLGDELGVSPSAETEALYLAAVGTESADGAAALEAADKSARSDRVDRRPVFPEMLARHLVALVGREAELSWLWSMWSRAREWAPLVVGIQGPLGSGRRSLVAVFAREVHATGAVVDVIDGSPRSTSSPAQPRSPGLAVVDPDSPEVDEFVTGVAALTIVVSCDSRFDRWCDGVLKMGPLDRTGVAQLMEQLRGDPPDAADVEALWDLTGGWPGAIAEAARKESSSSAVALASAAVTASSVLASARSSLADGLLRAGPRSNSGRWLAADESPFKGLARYEMYDAPLFHGRDQLVAEGLARVATSRVLVVVGSSGSGKSSLVRAGLMSELRHGCFPGSEGWQIGLVTPGPDPITALQAVVRQPEGPASADVGLDLSGFGADRPAVLIVDQFEDVFARSVSSEDRTQFVEWLQKWAEPSAADHHLVVVVRSDCLERMSSFPALFHPAAGTQLVVQRPVEPELRRMVSVPTRLSGLTIEPGLIDRIIGDLGDAVGGLPLLSTALLGAWQRRSGSRITIAGYDASGGVRGAIALLAENVWSGLEFADREVARIVLLEVAGDDATGVSPAAPRIELERLAAGADVVVDELIAGRLLASDGDVVRLAHEALAREWPRLRDWLDSERNTSEAVRHLRAAANEWNRRGRDAADLYRGTRLAAALTLGESTRVDADARAFLVLSAAAEQSEVETLRRRSRRQRLLLGTIAVLLVCALVAGGLAVVGRRDADSQARKAVSRQLVEESATAAGVDVRLLLATESRRLDDTVEARGALMNQVASASTLDGFLDAATSRTSIAISPDGSRVATGGVDGSVDVWLMSDRSLVGSAHVFRSRVTALTLSTDNRIAAGDDVGEVATWRIGEPAPAPILAGVSALLAVSLGAGGSLLTAGADHLLRSFVAATGQPKWTHSLPSGAVAGAFAANGAVFMQIDANGNVAVVDTDTGATNRGVAPTPPATVTALALSDDTERYAFGTSTGDLFVVRRDTNTSTSLGRVDTSATGGSHVGVDALAFSSSGGIVASAGGTAAWTTSADATTLESLRLASGRVAGLVVATGGRTAIAALESGKTVVFELRAPRLGTTIARKGTPITALATVGTQLAVATEGHITLLENGAAREIEIPGHPVSALSPSNAGDVVAQVGRATALNGVNTDGFGVVDARTGSLLFERGWYPNTAAATAVASDPASGVVAVGDEHGGQVRLFDGRTGTPLRDLAAPTAAVVGLTFAQFGARLIGVTADGNVTSWRVSDGAIVATLALGEPASALALSPDDRTAAVATGDTAVLINQRTSTVEATMRNPFGPINSIAFGLDGRLLAAASSGHVVLWDVASARPIGDPLPVAGTTFVAFDRSGRNLYTGSQDGDVTTWPVDPDRWAAVACQLAGRTMTTSEWTVFVGDRDYDPPCA